MPQKPTNERKTPTNSPSQRRAPKRAARAIAKKVCRTERRWVHFATQRQLGEDRMNPAAKIGLGKTKACCFRPKVFATS